MVFRAPSSLSVTPDDTNSPGSLSSNLPVYLRHNWEDPMEVTSRFLTPLKSSKYSGAEERWGLRARPNRRVSMTGRSIGQDPMARQLLFSQRLGSDTKLAYPLMCDAVEILSVVGSTITVESTRFRRYFTGCRVILAPFDGSDFTDAAIADERASCLMAEVSSVSSTTIVLTAPLPISIPSNWMVMPAFVGLANLNLLSEMASAHAGDLSMDLEEAPGQSALPSLFVVEDVTGIGYPYLNGYPVLEPNHTFNESASQGFSRPGVQVELPRGPKIFVDDSTPREYVSIVHRSLDRSDWYLLYAFWESRKGQQRPFWFEMPSPWWGSEVSITPGNVLLRVEKRGYEADIDTFLKAIAVRYPDGSSEYKEVLSISKIASTNDYLITVDSNFTIGGQVSYISPMFLGRFANDGLTEKWYSTAVCDVSYSVLAIHDETDHHLA